MSFRCEVCKQPQPSGTRPVRVVVERREVRHTTGASDYSGTQIVREQNCCAECALKLAVQSQ